MKGFLKVVLKILASVLSGIFSYIFTKSPVLAGISFLMPLIMWIFSKKLDLIIVKAFGWKLKLPGWLIFILSIIGPVLLSVLISTLFPEFLSKLLIIICIPPLAYLIVAKPEAENK